MFDIYSLAKPRVFKTDHEGSGGFTPSETLAPESVEYESANLNEYIGVITEEEAEQFQHPESAGRVSVNMPEGRQKTINVINAVSDVGGYAVVIMNNPFSFPGNRIYRTEFRPKQGLHNLDFTTPAETPSDDQGGTNQA